jgi:glutamine amidotransferase
MRSAARQTCYPCDAVIAIVDYDAGNLRSVKRACDAVGIESAFTRDPALVAKASRVIFPGVGHAQSTMDNLIRSGLRDAIVDAFHRGTPILGICVGAQLLLDASEEGPTPGLSLVPGMTRRFRFNDPTLKIPHIGWNQVTVAQPHPLLAGLSAGDELYFVHSYYLDPADAGSIYATADYGGAFCCALGRDNLFATQFHPEKSGRLGLDVLQRFATWDGTC